MVKRVWPIQAPKADARPPKLNNKIQKNGIIRIQARGPLGFLLPGDSCDDEEDESWFDAREVIGEVRPGFLGSDERKPDYLFTIKNRKETHK